MQHAAYAFCAALFCRFFRLSLLIYAVGGVANRSVLFLWKPQRAPRQRRTFKQRQTGDKTPRVCSRYGSAVRCLDFAEVPKGVCLRAGCNALVCTVNLVLLFHPCTLLPAEKMQTVHLAVHLAAIARPPRDTNISSLTTPSQFPPSLTTANHRSPATAGTPLGPRLPQHPPIRAALPSKGREARRVLAVNNTNTITAGKREWQKGWDGLARRGAEK